MKGGTRWDGSCKSIGFFLTVAHDILYFEISDSKRVNRWKFRGKIKKNTHFGELDKILIINFEFLNNLLEFLP